MSITNNPKEDFVFTFRCLFAPHRRPIGCPPYTIQLLPVLRSIRVQPFGTMRIHSSIDCFLDCFNTHLIIMHSACSSCNTLSKYIISKSDTIAPLITIISSLLIIPAIRERERERELVRKLDAWEMRNEKCSAVTSSGGGSGSCLLALMMLNVPLLPHHHNTSRFTPWPASWRVFCVVPHSHCELLQNLQRTFYALLQWQRLPMATWF